MRALQGGKFDGSETFWPAKTGLQGFWPAKTGLQGEFFVRSSETQKQIFCANFVLQKCGSKRFAPPSVRTLQCRFFVNFSQMFPPPFGT